MSNQKLRRCVFVLFCFAFFSPLRDAWALKFTNQFVEFELPLKWNCALEGAEWVCQNSDADKKRDAIIVLAAKLKGDQDSLEKYEEYLSKPREYTAPSGKQVKSDPKYHRITPINSHPWVDALHMESEVPSFYTRYLATVKQDIGVLITYSINKNKYQDYQNQFDDMVKSIRVFRKQGGVNTNVQGSIFTAGQPINTFTAQGVFNGQTPAPQTTAETPKKTKKEAGDDVMLLVLLAVAIGGFLYMRKRRKSGGGPS